MVLVFSTCVLLRDSMKQGWCAVREEARVSSRECLYECSRIGVCVFLLPDLRVYTS